MSYGITLEKDIREVERAYSASIERRAGINTPINEIKPAIIYHYCIPLENPSQIYPMEFGMCPSWGKRSSDTYTRKYKTLNINADSVFKSERFSRLIRERRCLVLGDAFFETAFKKSPVSYKYHLKGRKIFSVAGIYDIYDENKSNVVMIIRNAKKQFALPHNPEKSLPLILDPDFEAEWLDPTLSDSEIQNLLFNSCTKENIEAHPVGLKIPDLHRITKSPDELRRIRKI